MVKKVIGLFVISILIGVCSAHETKASVPYHTDVRAQVDEETENNGEHNLYIDGQLQTYAGHPIFEQGVLYVTIQAAVQALNDKADIDTDVPYANESPFDYLEENDYIEEIDSKEVIRVSVLQELGIQAEWLDNPGRLHLETADLLTVDDIRIGDSLEEVDEKLNVHWNTGYGQTADYIGFHGDKREFTYTDRYGKERSGDVPDIQFEILDDTLSYMILSSPKYETGRGISVGDSLFEVTRAHGSEYIEETIDGKKVHIYHVNDGSIWFIANENREVERIGLWGFQLQGYER